MIYLECGVAKVGYIFRDVPFYMDQPYKVTRSRIALGIYGVYCQHILSRETVYYEILNTSLLKEEPKSGETFPVGRHLRLRQSGEEKQIRPKLPQLLTIAR